MPHSTEEENKGRGGCAGKLCPQTMMILCAGMLILVSAIIFVVKNPEMLTMTIPSLVSLVITIFIASITINCMITGGCNVLTWIGASFYLLVSVIAIGSTIHLLYTNCKN